MRKLALIAGQNLAKFKKSGYDMVNLSRNRARLQKVLGMVGYNRKWRGGAKKGVKWELILQI